MTNPPRKLSATVHTLAADALCGKWGRVLEDPQITLSPEQEVLPPELRYASCVKLIAENAPIRILPNERIVGSATLKQASKHVVPVYSQKKPGGELVPAFPSVSHVTLGFDRVLKEGYSGIKARIRTRHQQGNLDREGAQLLGAMDICIDAARTWKDRHLSRLDELIASADDPEQATYSTLRKILARVPEEPATTFYEALLSLWFAFAFQRLCGNWPAIGRIDAMLGPYLTHDLENGKTSLDEARELLAHFWVKGCDWNGGNAFPNGSGDAQHYQNIVLSGVDEAGRDVTNAVTYLVLDVVEELHISDFPIAVRVGERTPEELWRRVADVQRTGGGIVAIYNDAQIINSLVTAGYPLGEARSFANDGCWEIKIPGKSAFSYYPIDVLAELQRALGIRKERGTIKIERREYASFDALFDQFVENVKDRLAGYYMVSVNFANTNQPATLVSLLVGDCISKGRGYFHRGARYTLFSPHAGGVPDAGNSLHVIKKLVFDERRLTLEELVVILVNDWRGHEALRQEVLNKHTLYGNDDPEADAMTRRVLDAFIAAVKEMDEDDGVKRPPGVSTFGRQIEWVAHRAASAAGSHDGECLSNNCSPAPGTDREGPTAVINSHCALGLERLTNGTALDIKIDPMSLGDAKGTDILVWLMKTFVQKGGIFLHIDVVNNQTLRDAQLHPERYQNLAVRVAGWSARFVTLNKEWQDMVIERTVQHG